MCVPMCKGTAWCSGMRGAAVGHLLTHVTAGSSGPGEGDGSEKSF